MNACSWCLARSWLLGRLAGHLDRAGGRVEEVMGLTDAELTALAGKDADAIAHEHLVLDTGLLERQCEAAGIEPLCQCSPAYPPCLRALTAPPAVLFVRGGLDRFCDWLEEPAVAIVGSRTAPRYALDVAHSLGRGLGCSDITVVSGMARGVDTAAHEGALAAGGRTIAVLAAAPQRPYPPAARGLHRRITATGVVVSELGPEVRVWRWMFPARNRIIAALSAMTVVVAARQRSGALVTARCASELKLPVGAVPGPVSAPTSYGPHQLLRQGAVLVSEPQDVLDAVFGVGVLKAGASLPPPEDERLRRLLDALAEGHDAAEAFGRAGLDADGGMAALASLELGGHVRRQPGGRFTIVP